MTRKRYAATFAAIAVVVVAGLIVVAQKAGPPAQPQAPLTITGPACQPSPVAAIDATPPGGTWTGRGCYNVPVGIAPTASDITINGGTFVDLSTTNPAKGGFQPIIRLQDVSNDTLENVAVVGANTNGGYHAKLVGSAGYKLINTHNLTFTNDSAATTFGDCMEVFAEPGAPKHSDTAPNTGLTVTNFTASGCGRDGISPSDVNGATFNNVVIGSAAQASIDFESDLKGLGAGNVTFNGGTWSGIIFTETLTGPIIFNNSVITNHIEDTSKNAQPFNITFNGGSLNGWPKPSQAIVALRGPNSITFNNFTFTRQASKSPPPLWNVIKGGHLAFNHCTLSVPLGVTSSAITVIP